MYEILWEDADLLVINKPPGVIVNNAGTTQTETIQQWMASRLKEEPRASWLSLVPDEFIDEYGSPEAVFAERQGIVHRLDKDTSGALLLAKNPGVLVNLLAQFQQRQVSKRYTCLVHGKFRVPEGTIQAPIERASYDRQQFTVSATGRVAETKYQVVQQHDGLDLDAMERLFVGDNLDLTYREFKKRCIGLYQGFSLVHCWPKTGRTHQIRVHLRHWGHPIVGDDKYVGKKRVKLDEIWVPRQFLHASELTFTHPRSGEQIHIEAPLTADLEQVLQYLK